MQRIVCGLRGTLVESASGAVVCMGDPEGGPQPSGLLPEQATAYAISFAKSRSITTARWNKAEQRTTELIKKIKGTQSSEERRKEVAEYVGVLIRKCFDCQVCTFGSVPLKTYLPDGDIDLTIVSRDPRRKDTWANDVRSVLEKAERKQDGKFRVKEVQYINAEVKVIKCHVENIVVDISFNQLGGLCTLCFLEEVDRVIGKDHFFKRSIILIKAWCYYESAILGATHGLFSTYALETLVLYIFHVFYPSLRGPLEVLLRFLEFFSKFDWDRFAVSVWGPVPLSSLPEMFAEPPRKDGGELLLSKSFLDACLEEYAVILAGQDIQGRTFTAKYLNVVDPLRAGNNLGRSVNQTNFNRIVKVLGHSAEKLLKILQDPSKDIKEHFQDKKTGFFKRTEDRLSQFEEKRPDAADGIAQPASTLSAGLNRQNGPAVRSVQENSDTSRPSGAETYHVDHSSQINPEGSLLASDSRALSSKREGQMGGNQGNVNGISANLGSRSDTSFVERESRELVFDNGGPSVSATNGNLSSKSEAVSLPIHSGVKGNFSSSEASEMLTGHSRKTNMDSLGGIADNIDKMNKQSDDASSNATHRSEQKDSESAMEFLPLRALPVTSRSNYTQTNFESNGILSGSSESPSSEFSRGSANFSTEALLEGPTPVRRSSPNPSTEKEGSRPSVRVGEQSSHVDVNGGFDNHGYVQQRGLDSVSRGSTPISLSVMPNTQVPVTHAHPGSIPAHLATSMTVSSMKGHVSLALAGPPPPLGLHVHPSSILSESPLGLGPRAGSFYFARAPPAPPMPPGYFHGPPLAHQLSTMGEMPNAASRVSSYAVQQGEDKGFEQQQREFWQQIEQQMQVRDHQQKYGYLWPASSMGAVVSPVPQQVNSENSFVIPSAPSLVTSGSFHIPASVSLPRAQPARSPPGNSRGSHNGSSTNSESLAKTAFGQDSFEDMKLEEIGKSWLEDGEMGNSTTARGKSSSQPGSEVGGRGSKNSKPSKEKRLSSKSKSTSNEDTIDVGLSEDGMLSSAESSGHGPAQGVSDDAGMMVQGYPQFLHTTGPALGQIVYPHLVPSLPSHGNGMVVSELSPYPPSPLVSPPRSAVGHGAVPSQSLSQSSSVSVGIPSGLSTSSRAPTVELANGSNGLVTTQRQRPTESTPLPQSVYYPPGAHYPFLSMYSTAYPIYMLPHSPDPAFLSMDLLNGFHLSSSLESYHDTSGSQSEDLRMRNFVTQQGRPGVGERLRAAGVATSTISRSEATATDTRASDAVDAKNFSSDLLSSDLSNHLRNLDYARWCQEPRVPAPMYVQPQFLTPSTKYFPDYRPWEGPGRPLAPGMNMLANVMSHGHGLVQGPPSMNTSARMVGNFPRTFTGPVSYGGDELPKSHGGTGPFLPAPRPVFVRDRQSSGSSRNQHGGYSQERVERGDRELNHVHGTRFRGGGRGQSKYEPRSQSSNAGVERNNIDAKGGERGRERDVHRQHEGPRRNSMQSAPVANFTSSTGVPSVTVVSPVSAAIQAEVLSAPTITGNGKLPAAGTGGGTVLVYPPEKKVGVVTEPLEFGSLGPVQVEASQGGSEVDHVSDLRTHEQVNNHGPLGFTGLSFASGDRSLQGPSPPKQRVMQRAYQLKEEDFPPLSFRGQHGSSSSGLNSGQQCW